MRSKCDHTAECDRLIKYFRSLPNFQNYVASASSSLLQENLADPLFLRLVCGSCISNKKKKRENIFKESQENTVCQLFKRTSLGSNSSKRFYRNRLFFKYVLFQLDYILNLKYQIDRLKTF